MSHRTSVPIELCFEEEQGLLEIANSRCWEHRLVERAQIILNVVALDSNTENARKIGVTRQTVQKWRKRYLDRRKEKPDAPVWKYLEDAFRRGCPRKFDEFFWIDVMAIATTEPSELGRPITHWTHWEIVDEVIQQKLATSLHPTTVGRALKGCGLQPHRTKEWMNRKKDPAFEERATDVKNQVVFATSEDCPEDEAVVSFDEKTGMQAKERIAPDQPMRPNQPRRLEFEYKRHGTLVLLACLLVNTGMIMGETRIQRTNVITAEVLKMFFEQLFEKGYQKIHIIADQLNTHWSIDMVEVVATLCNLPIPDAKEIQNGEQRRAWLSQPDKSIVFHFTPKHTSWLNPIEIWFGVLVKKVLRRGSFSSQEDLAQKVQALIEYYNSKMARPYSYKHWQKDAA